MDNKSDKNAVLAPSATSLSFKEKFSYGVGDFASNMSWTLVSSFLMFYYTDVFGLAPAVVGLLLMIMRIWDGFIDPVMGLIMERTKSRYGRFRPYLLFAPVVMAAFNILTFWAVPLSPTGKIIYAYATYLFLVMSYTTVNVPYGALATVMTQDHHERTTLNSFRMFATTIASIVIGTMTMPLIKALGSGNMQKGFFMTALTYSVISIPLFWLVFINCREIITPPKGQKLSLKDSYKAVAYNTPLMFILIYSFLCLSTIFGRLGMLVYYCTYNLKQPNTVALFMLVTGVCQLLGIMAAPYISKKLGKRRSAIAGSIVGACGLLIVYFSSYTNMPLIILGNVVYGFGCFGAPLMWSMTADCIEYAEWKSGVRTEGIIYATGSLITKFASAILGSVGLFVIGILGYAPNVEQTSAALKGINIMCNLVPGILFLLASIPIMFYKIDSAFYNKMVADIYKRRSDAKLT